MLPKYSCVSGLIVTLAYVKMHLSCTVRSSCVVCMCVEYVSVIHFVYCHCVNECHGVFEGSVACESC